MNRFHAAAVATAALLMGGAAQAEIYSAYYSAFAAVGDPTVGTNSQNLGISNLPPPSPGSVSFTARSTDANALPTRLSSYGMSSADVGNDPAPHVDAFAQSFGEYTAHSRSSMLYSIRGYVGGDLTGVTEIPLFIKGHILVDVLGATGRAEARLGLSGYVNPNDGGHVIVDDFCTATGGGCVNEDFTYAFSLDAAGAVAGQFEGYVSLFADAQSVYFGDPTGLNLDVITAHANIDPIVYIDPAFLLAHPGTTLHPDGSALFDVPPGGTGGGAGGVPEPASWALMIAGFGLAGAALRRRRTAAA